jgi:hypothetical protein
VDDDTVAAVGKLSEAMEWLERARGRLYDFHQMMGRADLLAGEAVELLRECGQGGSSATACATWSGSSWGVGPTSSSRR